MRPSRASAALRQIADRIDRSKEPSRARVSASIRGVLAAMDGFEVSNSPSGPWTPSSLVSIVERVEKMRYNGAHTDESNGIFCYVKKGERTFEIVDVEDLHGEDAQAIFQMGEVDEEGLNVATGPEDYEIAGDDLMELLNSIP